MAYDEGLATRVHELLGDDPGYEQRRMFGGLAVLLHGNLAVGVHGEELFVRADPEDYPRLLAEPGARPFDVTGRPMRGWVFVSSDACAEDEDLSRWVERGAAYARSLPPK